jgi:hypothetical protein
MEINSVVKRNNPVWNKETTQANFTLPALGAGGLAIVTGTSPATYIMITNTSGTFVDVLNMSVGGARGIPLAPGATFETAVDLAPPDTSGGTVYAIAVKTLAAAGGEVITVTYFTN